MIEFRNGKKYYLFIFPLIPTVGVIIAIIFGSWEWYRTRLLPHLTGPLKWISLLLAIGVSTVEVCTIYKTVPTKSAAERNISAVLYALTALLRYTVLFVTCACAILSPAFYEDEGVIWSLVDSVVYIIKIALLMLPIGFWGLYSMVLTGDIPDLRGSRIPPLVVAILNIPISYIMSCMVTGLMNIYLCDGRIDYILDHMIGPAGVWVWDNVILGPLLKFFSMFV